ncbi:hypothetical protein ACU686_12345 [Yinghuangia aomiensis]
MGVGEEVRQRFDQPGVRAGVVEDAAAGESGRDVFAGGGVLGAGDGGECVVDAQVPGGRDGQGRGKQVAAAHGVLLGSPPGGRSHLSR